MRKPLLLVIVSIMALQWTPGFAQSRVYLEGFGGTSFNTLSTGVMRNWGNGWTAGTGLSYELSRSINFLLSVAYERYPFQGDNLEIILPQIVGLKYSFTGSPTDGEAVSLGIRFISAGINFVSPFLSLNLGVSHYKMGKITMSGSFGWNQRSASNNTYPGSDISITNPFASIGFGLMVPVSPVIAMSVEGSFSQSFDSYRTFLPFIFRLRYAL